MLVDTDVLIWYMRGNERAAEFLTDVGPFSLSAVTYMELVQVMRNKGDLSALRRALRAWKAPVLAITEAISNRAMIYVEQHFLSHSLRMADALIAATAVEHGVPLATGNKKHHTVIPQLILRPFDPHA